MSSFPAEIIGNFILHINEDTERIENLLSCSLVSHTWCSFAQPFLYNRVVLNVRQEEKSLRLVNLLSQSPHIRVYIRRFAITGLSTSGPPIPTFGALPSLQMLKIESYIRRYDFLAHEEGLASLSSLLGSKCLTTLLLVDIENFPVQLLRQCLALQHLAIRHVTFSMSGLDADNRWRLPLKSFTISTGYVRAPASATINWFLSPACLFDLSQLETFIGLDRSGTDELYDVHCRFIAHVSSSLKTVLIAPQNLSSEVGRPNPLVSLEPQRLRNISSITILVTQDPFDGLNTLPWVIALLSGLPNPETLHDLTLFCDLWDHDQSDFTFHSKGWKELDVLLIRFHNLERVHVECFDETDEQIAKDLVSWLFSQLSASQGRGILSIKCSDHRWYWNNMEI
ncbi:hypothetical protein BDN72DRAFT_838613, partial [Pluteus cervinus]